MWKAYRPWGALVVHGYHMGITPSVIQDWMLCACDLAVWVVRTKCFLSRVNRFLAESQHRTSRLYGRKQGA